MGLSSASKMRNGNLSRETCVNGGRNRRAFFAQQLNAHRARQRFKQLRRPNRFVDTVIPSCRQERAESRHRASAPTKAGAGGPNARAAGNEFLRPAQGLPCPAVAGREWPHRTARPAQSAPGPRGWWPRFSATDAPELGIMRHGFFRRLVALSSTISRRLPESCGWKFCHGGGIAARADFASIVK